MTDETEISLETVIKGLESIDTFLDTGRQHLDGPTMAGIAIGVIERQQAEIERLKSEWYVIGQEPKEWRDNPKLRVIAMRFSPNCKRHGRTSLTKWHKRYGWGYQFNSHHWPPTHVRLIPEAINQSKEG